MNSETRAANGGLFRVINGRRVWIQSPPTSFLRDALIGEDCLTQLMAGQANPQDLIRLLKQQDN